MRPYPTATQPQFKLNHKSGGRGNRTDSHSESSRPLSHGRISPALGRPTPIQPFPNPDMDGLNRHSTASQPQPRLNHPSCRIQERFRLNHPTSAILQIRLNHNHNKTWGAYPPTTEGRGREAYPPTEGRCRRQSLEWWRYAGCKYAAPCAGAGRGGWITAWGWRR